MNMRKASERKRKIHAFLMSMTTIKMKFNRKCSSHTITIFHHINILSVINANEFQAPHLLYRGETLFHHNQNKHALNSPPLNEKLNFYAQ